MTGHIIIKPFLNCYLEEILGKCDEGLRSPVIPRAGRAPGSLQVQGIQRLYYKEYKIIKQGIIIDRDLSRAVKSKDSRQIIL